MKPRTRWAEEAATHDQQVVRRQVRCGEGLEGLVGQDLQAALALPNAQQEGDEDGGG